MTPWEYADYRIDLLLSRVLPPGTKLSAVRLTELRAKLRDELRSDYETMHRNSTEIEQLRRDLSDLRNRIDA